MLLLLLLLGRCGHGRVATPERLSIDHGGGALAGAADAFALCV